MALGCCEASAAKGEGFAGDLPLHLPFAFLQALEQGPNALVSLLFRMQLKVAERLADMEIAVAKARPVPGRLGDRFPDVT